MSSPAVYSSNDHLILTSWFSGTDCDDACDRPDVEKALDDRGYTEPVGFMYTRHQAAVAGVLLDRHQRELLYQPDARAEVQEAIRRRRSGEPTSELPIIRRLFAIEWSAGPGSTWLNLYCLLWVPTFERFVVTDSTDDAEPYGHADFAIGHFATCADADVAAMAVIGRHWRLRRDSFMDDEPQVIGLELGTIVAGFAETWLRAVWGGAAAADRSERSP